MLIQLQKTSIRKLLALLSEDWFEKAAKDMRRVEILLAADDVAGYGSGR